MNKRDEYGEICAAISAAAIAIALILGAFSGLSTLDFALLIVAAVGLCVRSILRWYQRQLWRSDD